MDQATLVSEQARGGEKLLARLQSAGLDLSAACWAKTAEDEQWYLYLVSPTVETQGLRHGYLTIRATLSHMQGEWADTFERINPFDVKLIGPSNPLARGVLELYQSWPDSTSPWHGGSLIGSVYVAGAYIYPASMFITAQSTP
jgi:hypothetical protein